MRSPLQISAGVPLTYWLGNGVVTSIENISSNFLKTPFTVNDWGTYRKNGFLPNITLTEIFSNKYTKKLYKRNLLLHSF